MGSAASLRREGEAQRERVVTSSLIAGLAVCFAGGVYLAAGEVRTSNAKAALTGTFSAVSTQQTEFHRTNARFATLDELANAGFALPPQQAVERTSADDSHWFLSLRDERTGLVCDRVGELTDAVRGPRPVNCRPGRPSRSSTGSGG